MRFVKQIIKLVIRSVLNTTRDIIVKLKADSCQQGVRVINSENAHVFFGYYDICPFSSDNLMLLAHRTTHPLSSPMPGSTVDIGFFNLNSTKPEFTKVGKSKAWCWQQGSRLQWYPHSGIGRNIFYNTVDDGKYVGIIQNIDTKEILKTTSVPLYEISSCGLKGLSLNFSRLQRLRPGYGYTSLPDETADTSIPQNDGVFLYDFSTDKAEHIIDFSRLLSFPYHEMDLAACENYINHLSFSPSGDKFMFLHLAVYKKRKISRLFVYNIKDAKLKLLNNYGKVSHYSWVNDNFLVVFCCLGNGQMNYVKYDICTGGHETLAKDYLKEDGHPSFISGKDIMLTDTYPNLLGFQSLILFDMKMNKKTLSSKFIRSRKFQGEVRTDLHPRVDRTKQVICIDDEYNGFKAIKLIEVRND